MPDARPVRPTVVAFDVVETLFALDPVAAGLSEAGLSPQTAMGTPTVEGATLTEVVTRLVALPA